ncbi:RagB/SusD family nutrient uptake outer membrane protein [Niabella sp. 22666]|uniref:RagB/SusD family nutrient uptake outer membrane protein n=1 Tax=Niabella sp. 22666 TaxID=3453954 RepID=UPI003F855D5B
MKLFIIIITGTLLLTLASCKKFLAAYSQNQTFIESADDLDELLIGEGYKRYSIGSNDNTIPDDDMELFPPAVLFVELNYTAFGVYYWQQVPAMQNNGMINSAYGTVYNEFYKAIAALNTILFEAPLMKEKGAPEDQLRRIAGEAAFLRAHYYLQLVSAYGKPYSKATAATDYGVPLKTSPEVDLNFSTRASVEQVYNQVEADLLEAEQKLEGMNEASLLRVNQAAAQALLSRVYLYRENYEKAIAYADKVLQKRYRIRNLNSMDVNSPFLTQASPEIIFTSPNTNGFMNDLMQVVSEGFWSDASGNFRVSNDLLAAFSTRDLRLQFFLKKAADEGWLTRKSGEKDQKNLNDRGTLRLPELYLNKAEALATLGRDAAAIATVEELRKNRFKPEDVTAINLSGEDLVRFIREERRRELCFEEHRWFDLRRYGVNSKYPFGKTIRHRSFAYNNAQRYLEGYYELKPYMQDQAAYVLPIPAEEIKFNRGSITNEPRPERPLITGE